MEWSDRIGRRVKLRDLHILAAVVQSGSMAKAAGSLAVSTPVVSKTIADLEHTVGVKLLDRSAQGVEPTIYGRALVRWAAAAFDDLRQGIKEIEFLTDPSAGEVRIGCNDPIAIGILPVAISRLHRKYPRLLFRLQPAAFAPPRFQELRERNVDVSIGRVTPAIDDDLNADFLFDDPLLVATGRGSRWLHRREIVLADLIKEPWVLPPPGSLASLLIRETFLACGLEPPHGAIIGNSIHMYTALLANGPYFAMLPASVLRFGALPVSVKVLPVKLPTLKTHPVAIITLKGRMISPAAQLFIDCVREVAAPLAQPSRTSGRRTSGKPTRANALARRGKAPGRGRD